MRMGPAPLPDDERHPAPDSLTDAARMLALGVTAGLRTVMPLALLATHVRNEGPDIGDGGWTVDLLSSPWSGRILTAGSLFEVVADKLPFARDRVEPLPLIGRVIAGGAAGALASLTEGRSSDRGALYGSLGAVLGTVGGYWLRTTALRVLPVPAVTGILVAFTEDAIAFLLGRWAVRGQT